MNHPLFAAVALGLFSLSAHGAAPTTPGTVFQDCKDCPQMVVVPAGQFVMGAPEDELGREADEGPQHPVTFARPFAVGRYAVTAGQWSAYSKATGATPPDGDTRPGRACKAGKPTYTMGPEQPQVCINYQDMQGYLSWLSKKTGATYRLLSEAEWEYAARAGSSGPFPFPFDKEGEYQISKHANTYGPSDGFSYTAPSGSYPANAFGLYDMHGNVYERVEDCWHENYQGAPGDGSSWTDQGCETRQIRGNDWTEAPIFTRSGNRNTRAPQVLGDWLGFRVARDL
ncbi:formylglycine-generating enzyme family protein [Pseudomonas alkylphenolica]|uniref:Chromophore maturation protein PvdO n=1 Tax=Pseudomonas alkylphenolica TaxID=237609 RepID=A0A077FBC2_9PSED|nr:formylglycine-generating enzyme family protein [Pseudomonas alkylphenolica]AIL61094.1 chromophore maturation protein PvdO [Pseudomonas alkylphenolica]